MRGWTGDCAVIYKLTCEKHDADNERIDVGLFLGNPALCEAIFEGEMPFLAYCNETVMLK